MFLLVCQLAKLSSLKYIRERPEQAHLPSASLVVLAEVNAFPCAVPTPTPRPK